MRVTNKDIELMLERLNRSVQGPTKFVIDRAFGGTGVRFGEGGCLIGRRSPKRAIYDQLHAMAVAVECSTGCSTGAGKTAEHTLREKAEQ